MPTTTGTETCFPLATPIERRYATDEYEFFVQDTWQINPELTLTAGLRYMLYSPPWETNGLQVAPTISMGEWFAQREQFGKDGIPSTESPIVTFDLAGKANGKKGYYETDKNNFAPSVALAWSPGDGDTVVRGGYYKVFDRIGMGLAMNFDDGNAYGMATGISSPYGDPYETIPGARFVGYQHDAHHDAGRTSRRLPGDPADTCRYHHREHRRHARDALRARGERRRRATDQPNLHGRGGVRGPFRSRPAHPPRHRDAAQLDGPRLRRGLLHGGAGDDQHRPRPRPRCELGYL